MKAALWLMHRCGVAQSLIGDVCERHATSSTITLWREAVAAILIALMRDLRMHPLPAAGAVLMGLGAGNAMGSFVQWLWTMEYVRRGWTWMVYDLGLQHQQAWLAGLASLVMTIPLWAATGWLMTRLTRTRVGAFAFVALIWCLSAPHLLHQAVDAINEPRFRLYLVSALVEISVLSLSLLAGALCRQERSDVLA